MDTSNKTNAGSIDQQVIDYKIAYMSRTVSLLGRKEVLNGKAKFGIFGDGKELAQIAMARAFDTGDWRSGYYRDQTFMFAIGELTIKQFFAQLYADSNPKNDMMSGGRQMNSHFSTPFVDMQGTWAQQSQCFNSSADLSPTGGQMARLLGLAYASKLYRNSPSLKELESAEQFSILGNEVAFGTIGNASTSEGVFWEVINAAGVLQVPMAISIWDDGYGISVPNSYQTTKGDLSSVLAGFAHENEIKGFDLYSCVGHDYQELLTTYQTAIAKCRTTHSPCIIHVKEMTQPQGHSTSGSHERYKSSQQLDFESKRDCLVALKKHLLDKNVVSLEDLKAIEREIEGEVNSERESAWNEYCAPLQKERDDISELLRSQAPAEQVNLFDPMIEKLSSKASPLRKSNLEALEHSRFALIANKHSPNAKIDLFYKDYLAKSQSIYSSHLYAEYQSSKLNKTEPCFDHSSESIDARQIIQRYFDKAMSDDPRVFIIGEDVGVLGGVNLEFEGLQTKFDEHRICDTGIREASILGQGLGSAMRGLRPIVDIQYLDYLLYALQGISDDLATLRYRSSGQQAAPLIVRTKGHRLEGIWHAGSPIGMLLGSVRGVHLCVPRNAVQAAGMYRTLLQQDDPAIVIEVLNGYRIKERCPSNLGSYEVPLGQPEILQVGEDLTLVTYGATVRIAIEAEKTLRKLGASIEIIDVQTLLPFDLENTIGKSIEKTHAVLFLDEDVPGGATAYMLEQVLVGQNAYESLDAKPRTLSAKEHRTAYGTDGDYFSKPNVEEVINIVYEILNEREPATFKR